ncbi:MAG: immunoglobulin domain-containing protein [Ferruginibacter sp.]
MGIDYIRVYTTTTSNTPVSGTVPGTGYTQIFSNTATTYASFTTMSDVDLTALAGTTVRLVFTFRSDGGSPHANPAVDNVSLTYVAPPAPTITGYSPSSGCALTSSITIDGTNLSSATAVTIGGTAVSSITSNTATQIVAVVGSGTTGTVSVTTLGGTANGAGTFTVNAAPNAYTMTGGGTACSSGSGVAVGLSGSQLGISYQLYRNGVATGAPVTGLGLAIAFGNQIVSGTYTVVATNTGTGCTRTQTGSSVVTINTAPSISVQPASQTKCQGSSVTFSVTAAGTSPTYQWRKNGSNIGGATSSSYTIASVNPGDAGNFDVVISVTGCSNLTSSTAVLTVVNQPTQFNMSGGGTICSTSSGVAVGLNNSQTSSEYQLYRGATPVGTHR